MRASTQGLYEFINENGIYLLLDEMVEKIAIAVRSALLGHMLKTQGLRIGPNSRIRGLAHMRIGSDFHAGRGLWLDAITRYRDQIFSPQINIGEGVRVSHWVHVAATHHIDIGDNCLFGSGVLVTDHTHGRYSRFHDSPHTPPWARELDNDRSVVIGNNVFLGDGVVVLPDVEIGAGSVVGANSVVTKNIPPLVIAAGVPATPIKRFCIERKEWKDC
jgi:lipopolysaccharide O-acetyltransferase